MSTPRIRLGTVTIGVEERMKVQAVLDSGFLSPGKFTKQFEEDVALAHGKRYGLALNSGQSAIMVVLEAMKLLGRSRRVAVPAITYISSISAIVQAGLFPQLIDVERTPEAAISATELVRHKRNWDTILPCHLFGRANENLDLFRAPIIEDACESIYAPGLGIGDAICLSFYPSHTITAGFGGMILTDDDDLHFKCWQLVNHGRKDWDDYTTCHTLKERFTFSEVGYSLKFSDLNAAFGLAQHERRTKIIAARRGNANFFLAALREFEDLELPEFSKHTFMMFPLLVKSDRRDALEKALNDVNIETRRMMPITTQPIIRELFGGYNMETNFPNANYINDHGLYFACHQDLTQENLEYIIQTISDFYNG